MTDPVNSGQSDSTPSNAQAGQSGDKGNQQPTNITVGGKTFASWDEVGKAYTSLDSEFHKRDSEIEQWRKFGENTAPVWKVLLKKPELYEQIQQESAKPDDFSEDGNGQSKTDEGKVEGQEDKRIVSNQPSEAEGVLRDNIIAEFEDKSGISQMDSAKKSEIRQKLAAMMAENNLLRAGETLKDVPLRQLSNLLGSAWKLHQATKLSDEGKLEGYANAVANKYGSFGSFSASGEKSEDKVSLTDAERKVALKMKMSEEDFAKYKEKISKGNFGITQRSK